MQPWAFLIVNGWKDIENRTWRTTYRGPVLIHAGKRLDPDFEDAADWMWPGIERPDDFEMGGIVGEAEIVGCITSSRSPWFHGPFGFLIRNARPLPFRPCRGQLGFFAPDYSPPEAKPTRAAPAPRQATLF